MEPSDERHVERFVRDPESMPDGQRRRAERLIDQDPGAKAYAEFLRGVYDRLEDEDWLEGEGPVPPSEKVDELVQDIFSEEEPSEEEFSEEDPSGARARSCHRRGGVPRV